MAQPSSSAYGEFSVFVDLHVRILFAQRRRLPDCQDHPMLRVALETWLAASDLLHGLLEAVECTFYVATERPRGVRPLRVSLRGVSQKAEVTAGRAGPARAGL